MCECMVDAKKIGESALIVEADLKEALVKLNVLKVSVSKHAASDTLVLKELNEITKILER